MVSIVSDPIEGTWLPFKAELAGEAAPDLALAEMRLVIRAGRYAVYFGDEVTDEGSYALSSTEEFHVITLTSLQGVNAGRTIPSIYQLKCDRLRICYGLDGIAPTAFTSSVARSRDYLVSYRRKT
jgi:uncharacterized protein (TIGR03067 family)